MLLWLFLFLLVLIVVFGPRVSLSPKLVNQKPLPSIDQLDLYVQTQEAQVANLIAGAEKKIVWANQTQQQTEYAFLYLHGLSATRQEMDPVPQMIAAQYGANLYLSRLSGHGRDYHAMAEPNANDWINDTFEAYNIAKSLGKKVVVLGNSTGASLAVWLAKYLDNDPSFAALVLLSPNFKIQQRSAQALTLPWAKFWGPYIHKRDHGWQPTSAKQAKYWTYQYPIKAIAQMQALLDWLSKQPLETIKVPTLFIYNRFDNVVDSNAINKAYEEWGSPILKRNCWQLDGEQPRHVLGGNIIAPNHNTLLVKQMTEFLVEVIGEPVK